MTTFGQSETDMVTQQELENYRDILAPRMNLLEAACGGIDYNLEMAVFVAFESRSKTCLDIACDMVDRRLLDHGLDIIAIAAKFDRCVNPA